jgi:cold shock CspA family protein
MNGIVSEFDDAAGYGWITADGGERVFFHCTQIADGTRTVAVGTPVSFDRMPYLGRYEAAGVTAT